MTLQHILPADPLGRLRGLLQQLRDDKAERRKTRAVYEQTWRELTAMSDRERADIGIHSSDIPRIASEAATMYRNR